MKNKIAVIGTGAAGIQAIGHFLKWLDNSWEVYSISDSTIPIFDVSISTTPSFISSMRDSADLDIYEELMGDNTLKLTLKFGTWHQKWRKQEFMNPVAGVSVHFNLANFKDWAFARFESKWGKKFKQIDGKVLSVQNIDDKAQVEINNENLLFDYVIDSTGFPENYDNYTIVDNPTNNVLLHNKKEKAENWLHTKSIATQDGWMLAIPLKDKVTYGYLFNDKWTDPIVAKENFAKEINVSVRKLDKTNYKFDSYYTNNLVDGKIIKNGNQAVFLEPMFANSLFLFDYINKLCIDLIVGNVHQDIINNAFIKKVVEIEHLICYFYQGGSVYSTPFWDKASEYSKKILTDSEALKSTIKNFKIMNTTGISQSISWGFGADGMKKIDKELGYNYFS